MAFSDVLGRKVSPDDNFFMLGGDSFDAVRVISRLGGNVQIVAVFEHPTAEELAKHLLNKDSMCNVRLVPLHDESAAGGSIAFVGVPFGGGDPTAYRDMFSGNRNVRIYGVDFGDSKVEKPSDFTALIDTLAGEVKKINADHLIIYGHCAGAGTAACLASAVESKVGLLSLVVAASQPIEDPDSSLLGAEKTSDYEWGRHLRDIGAFTGLSDTEIDGMLSRGRRDHLISVEACRALSQNPVRGVPALVLLGSEDPETAQKNAVVNKWRGFIDVAETASITGGGHYFIRTHTKEAADVILSFASHFMNGGCKKKVESKLIDDQVSLLRRGLNELKMQDPELSGILDAEVRRQHRTLSLVASCCAVMPETLAASASALVNVTAEGTPGKRYHAGCENVDLVESLAIKRACRLFGAQYAGVQPHSASNANYQVISALLRPGDTLLGMALDYGGHLSHGSPVTLSGTYYNAIGYGTTSEGIIDYDQVRRLAHEHHPRLIICGATAYSRVVDFEKFREIADEVGAILLADISHISGLVVTKRHPSPINAAHVTTTCTHKQLMGPRGGLIMSDRDADTKVPGRKTTFRQALQHATFPWMQGAPAVNMIAAKAAALGYAMTQEFDAYIGRIRTAADAIAGAFQEKGYDVIGGHTVNHTILIRLNANITGAIAESALEQCSIIVNKNRVPGETRSSFVTSGLRIGTGSLAQRYVDEKGCRKIVDLVCRILDNVKPLDEKNYELDPAMREQFRLETENLCADYPIKEYMK